MISCKICDTLWEDIVAFQSHLLEYQGNNELILKAKDILQNQKFDEICPFCKSCKQLKVKKGEERDFIFNFKMLLDKEYPLITTSEFKSCRKHFGKIGICNQLFVAKGWGYEKWIWNNKDYCGKLLVFESGKKCSFHHHLEKDEVLTLQSGKIIMKYSYSKDLDKAISVVMNAGDSFHVPPKLNHQMIALEDSTIVEFSTHHKEEDSYRIVKGD